MSVSLICSCKNRHDALFVSLSSWILYDQVKEIIIVDWSSDQSINYLTQLHKKIKVVSVKNQKYFNQPQPLNLAAKIAQEEYLLKMDTDYILNPYFSFFDNYTVDDKSFLCGQNSYDNPEIANSPYFKYLRGILYITRDNFLKVGGYNENFNKYYAYEDDEIVRRLELFGLEKQMVNYNHTVIHIPHSDKSRVQNFEAYDTNKDWENQIRQNLSQHLSGTELEWQVDYVLAQTHIEQGKYITDGMDNYYATPVISWEINQIDNQTYIAEKIV